MKLLRWGRAARSKTHVSSVFQGNFTYQDNGVAVQTFHLARELQVSYNLVQLQILSNHGNPVYTCIYRFRVHGNK